MGGRAKRAQVRLQREMMQATERQLARYNEEQAVQRKLLEKQKTKYREFEFKNPYAGVRNAFGDLKRDFEFENVYEDMTVNQQQAQFEKQMFQQQQANIMQGMQGAAGGSGIAALAQTMASQDN